MNPKLIIECNHMARQEGRVQRQAQCVPVGYAADEAYAQCASSTGLPWAWGSHSHSHSRSLSRRQRRRRPHCLHGHAAVAAKASNSLTAISLWLTYAHAILLSRSLPTPNGDGEGRGEVSNSMPAQIQRMLYPSGRPTWGRRANRAHISHWSLTFSANCEGWQTKGSVSNK